MSVSVHVKNLRFWCQKILPLVYDDSLSYYELLCKVVWYINQIIDNMKEFADELNDFETTFNEFVEKFNAWVEEISGWKALLDDMNERLSTAEGTVADLNALVEELNSKLSGLENQFTSSVEELQNNIDAVQDSLDANVTTLDQRIKVLEASGSGTGDVTIDQVNTIVDNAITNFKAEFEDELAIFSTTNDTISNDPIEKYVNSHKDDGYKVQEVPAGASGALITNRDDLVFDEGALIENILLCPAVAINSLNLTDESEYYNKVTIEIDSGDLRDTFNNKVFMNCTIDSSAKPGFVYSDCTFFNCRIAGNGCTYDNCKFNHCDIWDEDYIVITSCCMENVSIGANDTAGQITISDTSIFAGQISTCNELTLISGRFVGFNIYSGLTTLTMQSEENTLPLAFYNCRIEFDGYAINIRPENENIIFNECAFITVSDSMNWMIETTTGFEYKAMFNKCKLSSETMGYIDVHSGSGVVFNDCEMNFIIPRTADNSTYAKIEYLNMNISPLATEAGGFSLSSNTAWLAYASTAESWELIVNTNTESTIRLLVPGFGDDSGSPHGRVSLNYTGSSTPLEKVAYLFATDEMTDYGLSYLHLATNIPIFCNNIETTGTKLCASFRNTSKRVWNAYSGNYSPYDGDVIYVDNLDAFSLPSINRLPGPFHFTYVCASTSIYSSVHTKLITAGFAVVTTSTDGTVIECWLCPRTSAASNYFMTTP